MDIKIQKRKDELVVDMLSNNYDHDIPQEGQNKEELRIDKQSWRSVTHYIYTNMLGNIEGKKTLQKVPTNDVEEKYYEMLKTNNEENTQRCLMRAYNLKKNIQKFAETLLNTGNRPILYQSNHSLLGWKFGSNLVGICLEQIRYSMKREQQRNKNKKIIDEKEEGIYNFKLMYDLLLSKYKNPQSDELNKYLSSTNDDRNIDELMEEIQTEKSHFDKLEREFQMRWRDEASTATEEDIKKEALRRTSAKAARRAREEKREKDKRFVIDEEYKKNILDSSIYKAYVMNSLQPMIIAIKQKEIRKKRHSQILARKEKIVHDFVRSFLDTITPEQRNNREDVARQRADAERVLTKVEARRADPEYAARTPADIQERDDALILQTRTTLDELKEKGVRSNEEIIKKEFGPTNLSIANRERIVQLYENRKLPPATMETINTSMSYLMIPISEEEVKRVESIVPDYDNIPMDTDPPQLKYVKPDGDPVFIDSDYLRILTPGDDSIILDIDGRLYPTISHYLYVNDLFTRLDPDIDNRIRDADRWLRIAVEKYEEILKTKALSIDQYKALTSIINNKKRNVEMQKMTQLFLFSKAYKNILKSRKSDDLNQLHKKVNELYGIASRDSDDKEGGGETDGVHEHDARDDNAALFEKMRQQLSEYIDGSNNYSQQNHVLDINPLDAPVYTRAQNKSIRRMSSSELVAARDVTAGDDKALSIDKQIHFMVQNIFYNIYTIDLEVVDNLTCDRLRKYAKIALDAKFNIPVFQNELLKTNNKSIEVYSSGNSEALHLRDLYHKRNITCLNLNPFSRRSWRREDDDNFIGKYLMKIRSEIWKNKKDAVDIDAVNRLVMSSKKWICMKTRDMCRLVNIVKNNYNDDVELDASFVSMILKTMLSCVVNVFDTKDVSAITPPPFFITEVKKRIKSYDIDEIVKTIWRIIAGMIIELFKLIKNNNGSIYNIYPFLIKLGFQISETTTECMTSIIAEDNCILNALCNVTTGIIAINKYLHKKTEFKIKDLIVSSAIILGLDKTTHIDDQCNPEDKIVDLYDIIDYLEGDHCPQELKFAIQTQFDHSSMLDFATNMQNMVIVINQYPVSSFIKQNRINFFTK